MSAPLPIGRAYRVGRKLRRTIYLQWGPEPSDEDAFVGMMDDPAYAARVVHALNETGLANDDVIASCARRIEELQAEQAKQVRALERGRKRAEERAARAEERVARAEGDLREVHDAARGRGVS